MQKIFKLLVLGFLAFHVSSCEKDDPEYIALQNPSLHTSLVYIVADNNLSSYAATDIEEMIKGYGSLENQEDNNLLVYLDDKEAPRLLRIKSEKGLTLLDTIQQYPEQNSLEIGVMAEVINEAVTQFEAESYGLVLWSHADGWLPGTAAGNTFSSKSFGEDLNNGRASGGTRMDILDLKAALERGPKLEYLVFDACEMQSVEVAYELRDLTEYLIASPVEISAYGAPYEDMVPALFSASSTAENIAGAFFADYADAFNYSHWDTPDSGAKSNGHIGGMGKGGGALSPYGIAVSVVKTAGLEDLAAATKAILTDNPENALVETGGILSYDDNYYNFYYDLGGLVESLAEPGSAELQAWKAAYSEAVPLFLTTPFVYSSFANAGGGGMIPMGAATGISTFVPGNANFSEARHWGIPWNHTPTDNSSVEDYYSFYQEYYKNYGWYSAAGWSDLLE